MTKNKQATLLLAHGSSDANWLAPFEQLLQQIQSSLGNERVELAYMELAEPSLKNQVIGLVDEGYQHIDVLPLFFAAGRHLRKDVPKMLEELQSDLNKGPDLQIQLHPPIGLFPEVADAIGRIVINQVNKTS